MHVPVDVCNGSMPFHTAPKLHVTGLQYFQNVRDQAVGLTEGEELSWIYLRDLAWTVR